MSVASKSSATVFDGRVPFPEFASIETTMKCNLQCPMCLPYIEGSTVLGSHMELDDFEHIARAVFPYIDRFQLTVSGEPLMSKDLGKMLHLAEEYGIRTEYYTNGTLLNDRMISIILPTLGQVCISFDGATKDTFEYMRAGATFESVLRNVERLAAAVRGLPAANRPVLGFAVTVMEKNIRELPALVDLAHRLGLDFVAFAHVFPVIAEIQRQSLAHDVPLAKEWIEKALARGRELGIPVAIQPLDQVIVAMAGAARPSGMDDRAVAVRDEAVTGLEARSVNQDRRRAWPEAPIVTDVAREHVAARKRLRRRGDVIQAPAAADRVTLPESIWFCDFLWNRIYVTAEGTVRPCCVPGVPDVADFHRGDLESIWDNEAYRAMRIGLVRREPVPVCKGCQHVQQATDPAQIEHLLQGRSLPEPVEVPMLLRPVVDSGDAPVSGTPEHPRALALTPTIEWPEAPESTGYEFEASVTAGGKRTRFLTAALGIEIHEPRFAIPPWVWNEAPHAVSVEWRVTARMPRSRVVVARGCFARVEPGELPIVGPEAPPAEALRSQSPPVMRWSAVPGAGGYEFQASRDDFTRIDFSSFEVTGLLADPWFLVPDSQWVKIPSGSGLSWRALAVFSDRRQVVARGTLVREA